MPLTGLDAAPPTRILGIDTLWGGDVMNPSGTGRFIADCWFSDEPLPAAYTHPAAARAARDRRRGGEAARQGLDRGVPRRRRRAGRDRRA